MGELRLALLCDLSKAFDCVSHDVLLDKLEYLGVNGPPLSLLKSYLTNRKQSVAQNGILSSKLSVLSGVPQGSVLGPLLFIIYMNDFAVSMLPSHSILYADDSTLLISSRSPEQLGDDASLALERAEKWFAANSLKMNPNKTQSIEFNFSHSSSEIEAVKLLGITIDSALKWKCHVEELCGRLSRSIFLLRSLKRSFSTSVLITAYFANFHPILSYGVVLWGGSSCAESAFRIQKRAVRTIEGVGPRTSCKPIFFKHRIMPLPCIYLYRVLLEIHRNSGTLPVLSYNHSYNTRSANTTLLLNRHRLVSSSRNSLDLRLYNKLNNDFKKLPHVVFKRRIRAYLLEKCFYSVREYIEAPPCTVH